MGEALLVAAASAVAVEVVETVVDETLVDETLVDETLIDEEGSVLLDEITEEVVEGEDDVVDEDEKLDILLCTGAVVEEDVVFYYRLVGGC